MADESSLSREVKRAHVPGGAHVSAHVSGGGSVFGEAVPGMTSFASITDSTCDSTPVTSLQDILLS